jgi:SOS response regulatory protein OraA/RecX
MSDTIHPKNPELETRWSKLVVLLSIGERSPLWLKSYLKRHECPPEWTTELTRRAFEQNFISTKRYAEVFLDQAQKKGNKPFWILKRELIRRGIPSEEIFEKSFNDKDAVQKMIIKLSKKKWPREKLFQSLVRRGFSGTLIRSALAQEGPPDKRNVADIDADH